MNEFENLTIDWDGVWEVLKGIQVDTELGMPEKPVQVENESILVLEQRGLCRLSDETRRLEELRLAKVSRKKNRKKYTRKPGTIHPKKKARTARLRKEKRWTEEPMKCLLRSGGSWSIDAAVWNEWVAPLWKTHNPLNFKIKRTGRGTREHPHTIFNIQIIDKKTKAVLFDGNSLELYLLSSSL